MNWYNLVKQSSENERFSLLEYIVLYLNKVGINKDNYSELANAPMKLKKDIDHPDYEFLGSGSQNSVFKNKKTNRVEKYPHNGEWYPSSSWLGGKKTTSTKFDELVSNLNKAINLNVSRKLLNLTSLNTKVDRKGIIYEDFIGKAETARWRDIKEINKAIYYLDTLRTDGQGNVFNTENGLNIVDGIQIMPNNASTIEQKNFLEKLLKEETERIINELVQ
jgi:hypothetical protein